MNIKKEREKREWTLEELAVRVGVSVSSVHRWELGKAKPHRVFQKKLDKIFKKGM